jgi:hypothetical protein
MDRDQCRESIFFNSKMKNHGGIELCRDNEMQPCGAECGGDIEMHPRGTKKGRDSEMRC